MATEESLVVLVDPEKIISAIKQSSLRGKLEEKVLEILTHQVARNRGSEEGKINFDDFLVEASGVAGIGPNKIEQLVWHASVAGVGFIHKVLTLYAKDGSHQPPYPSPDYSEFTESLFNLVPDVTSHEKPCAHDVGGLIRIQGYCYTVHCALCSHI